MRAVPDHFDTRATFELAEESFGMNELETQPVTYFRDPAALSTLEKLAAGLRQHGYSIDMPRPGKACQAFCSYVQKDRKINIILQVQERTEGQLKCLLLTFYSQPLIYRLVRRDLLAVPQFTEVWREFCALIDKLLRETLAARSVKWDRLSYRADKSLRIN